MEWCKTGHPFKFGHPNYRNWQQKVQLFFYTNFFKTSQIIKGVGCNYSSDGTRFMEKDHSLSQEWMRSCLSLRMGNTTLKACLPNCGITEIHSMSFFIIVLLSLTLYATSPVCVLCIGHLERIHYFF